MNTPIDNFNLHILELKKLDDIFNYNARLLTAGIDISGLLRAEIVFAVSALDQFIHAVLIYKAMDILKNRKPQSTSFYKLTIGLDSVSLFLNNTNTLDALPIIENEIRTNLGWKSFQQPDKIAEALKIVCNKKVWDEVSNIMDISTQILKEKLKLIVKRRDSIAHEADFDLVNQCQYPIDRNSTRDSVNFIISLVYAIDSIVFDYIYNQADVNQHLIT